MSREVVLEEKLSAADLSPHARGATHNSRATRSVTNEKQAIGHEVFSRINSFYYLLIGLLHNITVLSPFDIPFPSNGIDRRFPSKITE